MNLVRWYRYGTLIYKFNPRKDECLWTNATDIAVEKYIQHRRYVNNVSFKCA